ncbi:unnamed protein product [Bursaphelenchus xylophilus]|uniref:(pine wood nematode) hypothetical protein n=1 Tax=Bursaphelenchus xylophilus TaxID=6326 RepID=A0A1I7RWY3_BURXY|nr:unnamed protein product [Bursaphelenchus xylophilus]CAG9121199.1 unnamed protein product [Bursaphelenchus xylophilus]
MLKNRHGSTSSKLPQTPDEDGVFDLEPSFVSHGVIDGAITCVLAVDSPYNRDDQSDETLLLAGTYNGDIYLYDLITKKYCGAIYKNLAKKSEKRKHETAEDRGSWILDEEGIVLTRQEGGIIQMGSLSTTTIWVQFRGGSLALFAWDLAVENKEPRLNLQKRIPFNHAGFCKAVYVHEKFILPDTMPGAASGFSVLDERCNKKMYELSEDLLRRDCQIRKAEIDKLRPFSGALMYIKPYNINTPDHYFVGFEDASLILFDAFDSTIVDWYQYYIPDQTTGLIAVASRSLLNSDDMEAHQFLVVLPNMVYLLYFDPREHRFVFNMKVKEWKGDLHCMAVTFGPEAHRKRPARLTEPCRFAMAFNWGRLEIFSLAFDTTQNDFQITHIYTANVGKEGVLDLNWSLRSQTLVACCVETKEGKETRNKLGKLYYYEKAPLPKKKKIKY